MVLSVIRNSRQPLGNVLTFFPVYVCRLNNSNRSVETSGLSYVDITFNLFPIRMFLDFEYQMMHIIILKSSYRKHSNIYCLVYQ